MKYILSVWSFDGAMNRRLTWQAPFKDEVDLIKSMIEYTRAGYYCTLNWH
jgi:hypothetical protein